MLHRLRLFNHASIVECGLLFRSDGIDMLALWFDLELIEAIPIDTDNGCLGDEGMRVDVVDDLEDDVGLASFGHDKQHAHLMSRVEALCGNDGSAAVRIDSDA